MKTRWLGMAVGLALAASAWTASAIEISDELRLAIQGDLEAIEKDGTQMGDVMAALRETGASYLPEIVAPIDVNKFQGMERRRIMSGVYLMDLTYATTFSQREPSARYGQAVYQLLDQVGFPQPDLERRYREALEQIDQPGGDEKLRQLAKEQEQDPIWQDKLTSGDGVELVADHLYGYLLEGLYLTAELCYLSNYDATSMMYVAYIRESFQAYNKLLYRLGDSPELAMSVEKHDRLNFLASILVILGDKPTISPAQLDALRRAITKARNGSVQ